MRADTLEYDPIKKTRTRLWLSDDEVHIHTEADVEDVIEENKRSFNAIDSHARWGEMALVASIPEVLIPDLIKAGIFYDEKRLRRWLDDPDNRAFRTRPGKLSR